MAWREVGSSRGLSESVGRVVCPGRWGKPGRQWGGEGGGWGGQAGPLSAKLAQVGGGGAVARDAVPVTRAPRPPSR